MIYPTKRPKWDQGGFQDGSLWIPVPSEFLVVQNVLFSQPLPKAGRELQTENDWWGIEAGREGAKNQLEASPRAVTAQQWANYDVWAKSGPSLGQVWAKSGPCLGLNSVTELLDWILGLHSATEFCDWTLGRTFESRFWNWILGLNSGTEFWDLILGLRLLLY